MDKNLSSILAASVFGILVLVSQSAKADLSCIGFKSQQECEYKMLVDKVGAKTADNDRAKDQYRRGQYAPAPAPTMVPSQSSVMPNPTPQVPVPYSDSRPAPRGGR